MGTNSSNKSNGSSQLTNGNNIHSKSNSAQVDPGVTLTQASSVLLDYSAVSGVYAQNWIHPVYPSRFFLSSSAAVARELVLISRMMALLRFPSGWISGMYGLTSSCLS